MEVGGRSQGWVCVRSVGLGWVVLWLGWFRWCGGSRVGEGGGGGGRGAKPRVGGCA